MRFTSLLFPLLAACGSPEPAPLHGDAGRGPPGGSRDAASPPGGSARRAGPAPMTLSSADPSALAEILAAAPPPPTGGPVLARIGTNTGEPPASPPPPSAAGSPAAPPRARIEVGAVRLQTDMSTPAIEKAARAQLYWDLVQRCRDPEGKILPPDAIRVEFNLDEEGTIAASTIVAIAADPRHSEAAACMQRELAAITFRAPAGARGLPTHVSATVPSVD
jgi:hypothetical protein